MTGRAFPVYASVSAEERREKPFELAKEAMVKNFGLTRRKNRYFK